MNSSSTHDFCFAVIEWQILHAVPLKYNLGLAYIFMLFFFQISLSLADITV